MAWLHATPEGSKESRYKSYLKLDENSSYLKFPKIENAEHVIELLQEAGLVSSSGMGPIALTWQEIESWLRVSRRELSLWEINTVRRLSEVYVGEYSASSDKNRPAPFDYIDEELQVNRVSVANKLKEAFKLMKQSK